MITVSVTSDSSVPELRVAERTLSDLISLAIGRDMEKPTLSEIAEQAIKISNEVGQFTEPTFNPTELAEAEELGKSAHSTVDAEASQTAHADMPVTTSTPAPTTVFGQPAQTTVNEANPVAQTTDSLVRDANGILWDERIHSSSKEFVKDGTWRRRRGVSDDVVALVEAELRGEHSAPVPQPKPPVDHSHEGETPVFTATIPTDMTFPELLDAVTKAMVAGNLTHPQIVTALQSVGLEALPHLMGHTDKIPAFREALGGVV